MKFRVDREDAVYTLIQEFCSPEKIVSIVMDAQKVPKDAIGVLEWAVNQGIIDECIQYAFHTDLFGENGCFVLEWDDMELDQYGIDEVLGEQYQFTPIDDKIDEVGRKNFSIDHVKELYLNVNDAFADEVINIKGY